MVENIWDQFLTIIKNEVGSRVVETWFKAVTLHRWDMIEKTVHLKAPNTFVRNWIRSNYTRLLQEHLSRLLNVDEVSIVFSSIDESSDEADVPAVQPTISVAQEPAAETTPTFIPSTVIKNRTSMNKNYVFDTFVVGPSNSLAFAAAQAVTERPGKLYNPLFIYGGSGLGKTHLMHAIGSEIRKKYHRAQVLYQPADRFVTEFISAIRFDKVHAFKAKYQTIDVLLVDDVHCISNKEQTQEAFFHIFNALYESHKQIIFSSDTFPQNIHGLAERLRSRLACGLVVDIQIPPLETKIAILNKKAQLHDEILPDDVAHFIASLEFSNIRELEGALIRVLAFASLTKQTLSMQLAQKVLDRMGQRQPVPVDFARIIKSIQRCYTFSIDQLRSTNRSKDIAQARHIAIYLMKDMTKRSFRDIADYLGGRDHSTILHAYNKVKKTMHNDTALCNTIQQIKQDILR